MDKKILVTKSSMPSFEEYCNEIQELWDSRWLTNMGVKHRELQKELQDYLGVGNLELMVNGHMALEMTIQAFELKGEVITTPYTFASTTHAIVRNGLKPVFCDIKVDDFTIDTSKIEALITENTSAILPVHVYGNLCDVDGIQKIADKYKLKVIYDAAHAFGETIDGVGVGSFGDAACFSFHATKVFNSIEGGAVCYKDEKLGGKLYDLKNFGIHGPESVTGIGANAKMNEFCAAMGICNLRHISDEIAKRELVDKRYRENLSDIKGIQLNKTNESLRRNFSYFPIIINKNIFGKSRDDVQKALAQKNVNARKYFYPLTNDFECYANKFDSDHTPIAEEISNGVLTLPQYADLSMEDVDMICSVITECGRME